MSSAEGEVIQVQNLESYLYNVNWDVMATMKSRGRHHDWWADENLIFRTVVDTALGNDWFIPSEAMTYSVDLNSSHSVGPTINFKFFIEKESEGKSIVLYVNLKSENFNFEIGSASVRFKNYNKRYDEGGYLISYCSPDTKLFELEKLKSDPKSRIFPWLLVSQDPLFENSCVQWAKLSFVGSPCFTGFNSDFLIQPKVHGQQLQNVKPPFRFQCAPLLFSHECSDVTISCGLKEYPAHKVFICSKSSVLKTMFEQPMAENLTGKLKIEDAEPEIVEEFLRFIYTGAVTDLAKNAPELFRIAHKYDVLELKNMSEQSILKTMKRDNVLEIYGLGKLLNSDAIVRRSVEKTRDDKNLIWETKEKKLDGSRQFPELFFDMLFLE